MEKTDMLVVTWALYNLAEKGLITEEMRQGATMMYMEQRRHDSGEEITDYKEAV